MRVALVSDIHGNLVALKAVLRAMKRVALAQIICLGDIASVGPHLETGYLGVISVLGNGAISAT